MYDYELPFSEDAKAQKVIEEYLQQQMVRAVERIIGDDEVVRKFRNEEKLTTEEIVLLRICSQITFSLACLFLR